MSVGAYFPKWRYGRDLTGWNSQDSIKLTVFEYGPRFKSKTMIILKKFPFAADVCDFSALPAYMELYEQLVRAETGMQVTLSVAADGEAADKFQSLLTAALNVTAVMIAGMNTKVRLRWVYGVAHVG